LTGETLQDTRKRLRAEKKASNLENKDSTEKETKRPAKKTKKPAAKREKKPEKTERAPKAKAEKAEKVEKVRVPKVAPTHDKNGVEYLVLAEFDFKRENYFFVPTPRSFEKIKDHFLEQKQIGFDVQYHQGLISTISLASKTTLAVIDMHSLMSNPEVKQYILDLLNNDSIEKITHTFGVDNYLLAKGFDVEELKYKKVVDLSQIIKEGDSDNSLGLKTLVEKYLKKALNQYYKKSNWAKRPIEQDLIDYSALNAYIILKILIAYEAESKKTKHANFEITTFKENPFIGTWPTDSTEKKPRRTAEKGEKKEGNRSRRRAPKKDVEAEPTEEKVKRPSRGRGGRRPENAESNVNTHEDKP
jgi:hypothetical protein